MNKDQILDLFNIEDSSSAASGCFFEGRFIEFVDMPAVIELLLLGDK